MIEGTSYTMEFPIMLRAVMLSFISWGSDEVQIPFQSVQMEVTNFDCSHTTRNVHSRSPWCSEAKQYTLNAFVFHQDSLSCCTAALTGNVETARCSTHTKSLADCFPGY